MALADYTKAVELDPKAARRRSTRAKLYAELGRWDAASADFTKALELKPDQAWLWYSHALTRLGAGDVAAYRIACAAMLNRFGKTKDAEAAHWAAWTCILAPNAVAEPAGPVALAERSLASKATDSSYLCTLGAALYRAGRFNEARQRLNALSAAWDKAGKMTTQTSPAYAWFFLAMAHHRLGQATEAGEYLRKAVKRAEEETRAGAGPAASWNRRLTLKLLQREAEVLLGVTPTSAPAGRKETAPASKPKP